ncbi:chloroplast envelope quinone oxidoreductase homolog [Nymphaea colorata]|nr:chloroplast envelope quinone oxidoreductase homolog [Nymphaea colorata]
MASSRVMHAVQYDHYGGGASALKHVEVPVPTPNNDEILLKLEASSLNPLDCKLQKGMWRPFIPHKFPAIPVSDISGEVVDVGAGVQNFKVGDKVVSMLSMFRGGGLAEYAVVTCDCTVKRPQEVSAAEGAALTMAGLTALQALAEAGIKLDSSGSRRPKANVLITAASGGVGHYAVQLAKLGNAHVTATCGARNIDLIKSLGADEVLDYRTPEGELLRSPSGKKYDAVIHCARGIPWSVFEPNLSERGKVIDLTPDAAALWTFVAKKLTFSKKSLVPLIVSRKGEDLEVLVQLAKEGKLRTLVDSTFPLEKAEEAWAKVMDAHATGKIIVASE